MPTYEYKCDACGHGFEKFQSMSAEPIKKCPSCGKNKVKRLIGTGAGLIFKGSGFYITDYRDAGYKDQAKAESGGGSSADTKGGDAKGGEAKSGSGGGVDGGASTPSTSSDAKPAAKSEPKGTGGDKPASGGDKPSGGSSSGGSSRKKP